MFSESRGLSGEVCQQLPTNALGNWYIVMDYTGSIGKPYAVNETLVGPDFNNSFNNFKQAPTGGIVSDVLTIHWKLPYRFNTVRFDLIADTSYGPGAADDHLTTNPVTVAVIPAALMQLKVLPYTILYAPAGDKTDFDVHIYYDNMFGTYLYVYPQAPCKLAFDCGTIAVANVDQTQSIRQAIGSAVLTTGGAATNKLAAPLATGVTNQPARSLAGKPAAPSKRVVPRVP